MQNSECRRIVVALSVALALTIATACSGSSWSADAPVTVGTPAASPGEQRKYLLETVDDASVVQLYADSFETLSLREKTLIWHLYQAALAGRDIFFDQRHRHGLEMRAVLEAIVTHPDGIDPATLKEIHRYTKLFWINSGAYNNLTSRKFVLNLAPDAFAAAAHKAAQGGATFPAQKGESLDALLARLQPMFFDPDVDPISTNKNPGPGKDMLLSSAANLYDGVTLADLDARKGFAEAHGLNSRLVKRDGRLTEEVYRIGGRYSKELTDVVRHL